MMSIANNIGSNFVDMDKKINPFLQKNILQKNLNQLNSAVEVQSQSLDTNNNIAVKLANEYHPSFVTTNDANLRVEVLEFLLKYLEYNQDKLQSIAELQKTSLVNLDQLAKDCEDILQALLDRVHKEVEQKMQEAREKAKASGIFGIIFNAIMTVIAVVQIFILPISPIILLYAFVAADSIAKIVGNAEIYNHPESAFDNSSDNLMLANYGVFGLIGSQIPDKQTGQYVAQIGSVWLMVVTIFAEVVNTVKSLSATTDKVLLDKMAVGLKICDAAIRIVSMLGMCGVFPESDNQNFWTMLSMGIAGGVIYLIGYLLEKTGIDKKNSDLIVNSMVLLAGLAMLAKVNADNSRNSKIIIGTIATSVAAVIIALPEILKQMNVNDEGISQELINMLVDTLGMVLFHLGVESMHSPHFIDQTLAQQQKIKAHMANYEAPNIWLLGTIVNICKMNYLEFMQHINQFQQVNAGTSSSFNALYSSCMELAKSLSEKESSQIDATNGKTDASRELLNKMLKLFSTLDKDYVEQIQRSVSAQSE
jgi:hypothetical protein